MLQIILLLYLFTYYVHYKVSICNIFNVIDYYNFVYGLSHII